MKEKILRSNRYKRYLFYIYLTSGIFITGVLFFIVMELSMFLSNPWIDILIFTCCFGVLFLPVILFYSTKCLLIRLNIGKYKAYSGTITSIETAQYIRSDHRLVTIRVDELNDNLYAKVYKGDLYDKVAKDIKLELAFNESNQSVIILGIL